MAIYYYVAVATGTKRKVATNIRNFLYEQNVWLAFEPPFHFHEDHKRKMVLAPSKLDMLPSPFWQYLQKTASELQKYFSDLKNHTQIGMWNTAKRRRNFLNFS